MSDRRGSDLAFSPPLKVEAPGRRPLHHRGSARRDRARAAFLALVDASSAKPWAKERMRSEEFLGRGRTDDFEALAELLRSIGVG